MILAGVSMMRDEADIGPLVARHMAEECDFVFVADHGSVDGTRELLEAIPGVEVSDAGTERYDQQGVLMRLIDEARRRGADWVIPFDADEWWYAERGVPMRVALGYVPGSQTLSKTYELVPQHDDPPSDNPFLTVRHYRPHDDRTMPENRKVAFRPAIDRLLLQGSHWLLNEPAAEVGPLRVCHLPYRSFEQAARKLRHGKAVVEASGLPPASAWHWRRWGAFDDASLGVWWREWTDPRGLVTL